MKLTRLLTLSTAGLAVLVFGMLGYITLVAWRHYEATGDGMHALQLTQRAMIAAEKLSYERGPVNALLGDRSGDPARRERLRRARAATDLALLQLQRELRTYAPAPQELAPLQAALSSARAVVDEVLAQAPAERSPERLRFTLERMYRLVPLALDATTGYTLASEQGYPRIARTLIKARYAVELREYAGRMGSVLTVPLATRLPVTAEQHEQLQALRGRIFQLRQQIQFTADDSANVERLAVVIARMDSIYFGEGQQLVAAIEQASRGGQPYALDTAGFVQRYVPTMTPIVALRDELLQEAREQAQRDLEHARAELMLACWSGLAILLALTLLMLIVRRRVVVPMLRATKAAVRLGNGDYSRDPAGYARADEIGDMLRALSTLRNNSIERQQLELDRQRLIEELRLRADTDYLTGILNRRAFSSATSQRLRKAREDNQTLSVLLFDIDLFKSVNDSHGHDVGDQVLIRVATLVRAELRDGEILARHGGEEFVVMPAHCSLEQACALAERLRQAIADEALTLASGHVLRVTASFGVASATGPQAALDHLLNAADVALYRAKHNGRNRVESEG